jgi:hypothetical protein
MDLHINLVKRNNSYVRYACTSLIPRLPDLFQRMQEKRGVAWDPVDEASAGIPHDLWGAPHIAIITLG